MELKTTELGACGPNRPFRVLGTMSGTSMDALDLAEAEFTCTDGRWKGSIEALHEVPLDATWPERFGALARAGAAYELGDAATVPDEPPPLISHSLGADGVLVPYEL